MQKINEKISQAKAKLLVEYPLFGTIASKVSLILNDDIEAFKSDGIKLEYNSDFVAHCGIDELQFVFANAAMHASLAHEYRKNNRSGWLWQMATDYAINDMLVENGFERPDEAPYTKRFKGLYAEEIYEELKADILRDDELEYEADESDSSDDVKKQEEQKKEQHSTPELSLEQMLQAELFSQETQALIEAELAKGEELPQSFERFFDLNRFGKINWRDELRNAVERFYKDDYSYMPPNKKFLSQDLYLPAATSERFNLVVAVDSSGSVDDELLSEFLSELNFLMLSINNYKIDLLVCDDTIRSHTIFYNGESLECSIKGGGGTDFRPVFEFINIELPDTALVLYFSDLDGMFPKEEPFYEVKWVSPKESEVPFGSLILLED